MKFPSDAELQTWIWKMICPLVSLLIKNSVSHRLLCQELKQIYVDVAAAEYGKGGRPTNISRIALLTGLDRKDVKRIRDARQASGERHANSSVSQSGRLGRVLTAWYQDPQFSADGKPRALSRDKQFVALCKRHGGDITHTAILKELERVKAVITLSDGKVVAVSRFYMPDQADCEAVARSCDVYHDVGNTLLHNLYRGKNRRSRFEGRATNPHIPMSRLEDFRAFVERRGQRLLEDIDTELSSYQRNSNGEEQTVRLGLGMYWIQNPLRINFLTDRGEVPIRKRGQQSRC